jgi:hypothetical protein
MYEKFLGIRIIIEFPGIPGVTLYSSIFLDRQTAMKLMHFSITKRNTQKLIAIVNAHPSILLHLFFNIILKIQNQSENNSFIRYILIFLVIQFHQYYFVFSKTI